MWKKYCVSFSVKICFLYIEIKAIRYGGCVVQLTFLLTQHSFCKYVLPLNSTGKEVNLSIKDPSCSKISVMRSLFKLEQVKFPRFRIQSHVIIDFSFPCSMHTQLRFSKKQILSLSTTKALNIYPMMYTCKRHLKPRKDGLFLISTYRVFNIFMIKFFSFADLVSRS